MRNAFPIFVLVAMATPPSAVAVRAGDWPHWRGPDRNDHVAEESGWDARGWPLKDAHWTANVGEGASSSLVVAGRLYCVGWKDDQDRVYCLDAATGTPVWTVSYKCPRFGRYAIGDETAYSGPTSTPEYDTATGLLYTLSCDGDLNCWNAADRGARLWGMNLYARFGVGRRPASGLEKDDLRDYGCTTAPYVYGDWVVVEVGAQEATVMAFDKRSGEPRWSSEYGGPAGHSGGLVPITVEQVACVALLTQNDLLVVRLDRGHEGKTVARYPWKSAWANNVLTPSVQEDCILISSWHSHQSICKLKITLQGAARLWEQPYASHVGSPVVHGDHIYFVGDQLRCLDWNTGRLVWEGGSHGYGGACILTGDDKLIVWSDRGHVSLVESSRESPKRYTPLARMTRVFTGGHAWPHPAIADGRLFCKDREGNLKCFSVCPAGGRDP